MSSTTYTLEDAAGFFIPTPMAKAMQTRLEQWLHCGATGGLILGAERLGKTRSARALGKQLYNRSGQPIHVFQMHYGKRDQQSIRAVHAKVATALGFYVGSRNSDKLCGDTTQRLAEASLSNDARQVVLVVDEAQFLSIDQIGAFAEIHNSVVDKQGNCVVFFIANRNQFQETASALLLLKNKYLVDRFFLHLDYFHGIRTEQELAACLAGYDACHVSQSPDKTAIEYYCPKLAQEGWRLSSLASAYWKQFRERFGIPLGISSLGMATFVRTTNLLVMDYLPCCNDARDIIFQEACVIKSLEAAGIEPSLVGFVSGKPP